MLNDFVHGKLRCKRAKRIIPNIKLLLSSAWKNKIPIFFCNDEHLPIDTYEMKLWGLHAMKVTEGSKVIDELEALKSDYIIPKRTYSAFYSTELDKVLKGVYNGKGANTVTSLRGCTPAYATGILPMMPLSGILTSLCQKTELMPSQRKTMSLDWIT